MHDYVTDYVRSPITRCIFFQAKTTAVLWIRQVQRNPVTRFAGQGFTFQTFHFSQNLQMIEKICPWHFDYELNKRLINFGDILEICPSNGTQSKILRVLVHYISWFGGIRGLSKSGDSANILVWSKCWRSYPGIFYVIHLEN